MTHVVTDACCNCKHTDCVPLCPTESFHEGPNFVVINPDECIDCGLCVTECPVDAIIDAKDLPTDDTRWVALNQSLSQTWPQITRKKAAAAEAQKWAQVKDKFALIER